MTDDIYNKLGEHLDEYGQGFVSTESGVELRILKKLFSKEEAEMFLNLTEDLQSAAEIAEKIHKDPDEVEHILQQMMKKGLTFPRYPRADGEPFFYAGAPFCHGILENQLKRMDKDLAELTEEYFNSGGPFTRGPAPLRVIPVRQAVDVNLTLAHYDDVKAIVLEKKRIAVADCLCHEVQYKRGETCDRPREVCFLFDFYGQYFVDTGMGRWVTPDEALKIIEECEKVGLVPRFSNSENPECLCNCCPDCCQGIRILKRISKPGLYVPTNYHSQINIDLCTGCDICIDRCPMTAISMSRGNVIEINLQRCIGCGICVTTCPSEAIGLKLKPEEKRCVPPQKGVFMKPSNEIEASIKKQK